MYVPAFLNVVDGPLNATSNVRDSLLAPVPVACMLPDKSSPVYVKLPASEGSQVTETSIGLIVSLLLSLIFTV